MATTINGKLSNSAQVLDGLEANLSPRGPAQDQYVITYDDATGTLILTPGGGGGGMANPMTTLGDIIFAQVGGTPDRLPIGTAGYILRVGVSGVPEWSEHAAFGALATRPVASGLNEGESWWITDADPGLELSFSAHTGSGVWGWVTLPYGVTATGASLVQAANPGAGRDALGVAANGYMGAVCIVDQTLGSDITGTRSGLPFATITAALAAATAGDCVWIMPGTYSEAITIPTGVAVRGINTRSVTIQQLLVTADTTLVTMGEGSRLEDVNLLLTSAGHHTLIGILWPGTTTATAKLRTSVLTVDNSAASAVGTSNVYGYQASGTGTVGETTSAVRASAVVVRSAGLGNKRAILVSGATEMNFRDIAVFVTNAGGAGSFIGAETTNAGSVLRVRLASIIGPTADISQTAGRIELGTVTLGTNNANGLGFDVRLNVNAMPLIYADSGELRQAQGTCVPARRRCHPRRSMFASRRVL